MRGSKPTSCAACKVIKRRCDAHCVLAPHFPLSKTREFEAIRKVFGTSNITKMLTDLDPQGRIEAVKSFEWEALMWEKDPVHGPLGAFTELQRQHQREKDLNLELKLRSNFQSCDGGKVNEEELGTQIGELGQDGNSENTRSERKRDRDGAIIAAENSAVEGNVDQNNGRTQS